MRIQQQILSTTVVSLIVFMLFISSIPLFQSSYKANADAVTDTIKVGNVPRGIAYNPDNYTMYVTNAGLCGIFHHPGLSIIDLNGRSRTYDITEDCAADVAWYEEKHQMFITNFGDDTVSVIAAKVHPYRFQLITDGIDDGPLGIAYNDRNEKMYVINQEDDDIAVIGDIRQGDVLTRNVVLQEIELPDGDYRGIAHANSSLPTPEENRVAPHAMYVTDAANDNVVVIWSATDPSIGTVNSTRIAVGDQPRGIAYNEKEKKMYVTNYGSGTVTVFDTNLLELPPRDKFNVNVGSNPLGIAYYPIDGCMYVTLERDGEVIKICNGAVVGDPIKVGGAPIDIAYNEADRKIYVTNAADDSVSVITPTASSSRAVTKPLETVIPVGEEPLGIAFNPANNNMYVTSRAGNSVSVLSGSAVLGTIPAPGTVDLFGPYGIAFNAQTQRMYVANQRGDSTVSTLNDTTIEDTITAGAAPTGVAFEPLNNLMYVTNLQDGTVSVISGNTIVDTIEVGGNPFGVATNTVNTKVYVTSGPDNNFVSVIDDGNVLTKTIEVGASPHGIAFNPSNNKMYVANYYNDSISLIDVNTDTVTNTITGIRTPGSIAYNPVDNSMYVTNFESDTVTVIEDTIVKTTIPGVGDGPYAIAFNPANEKMYVTNEKENSVTIIGPL